VAIAKKASVNKQSSGDHIEGGPEDAEEEETPRQGEQKNIIFTTALPAMEPAVTNPYDPNYADYKRYLEFRLRFNKAKRKYLCFVLSFLMLIDALLVGLILIAFTLCEELIHQRNT
jgi:hypothetical protein